MAHFYGKVRGKAGEASRLGSKASGLTTTAAGWQGAVSVHLHHDEATGQDRYTVELVPWLASGGRSRVLAEGVLDANTERALPLAAQ